ncbi:MAG: type 4a pilus biogenesis protein PilO [Candidatus Daviesbacteria bacterium]|nr:type 4a pilus biogenesis protein PilO [Candidatus Daviesbacteria bacterium]
MATNTRYSRYYTYIKPLAENKAVKSVAPYIFSLITIMILIIFAIRPTVSTIINLQKNIEENQQVLKQLETKAQNLIEGKKNYENLPPDMKQKINDAVPNQPNVTSVISSLDNSSGPQASASALQIQPLTLFDDKTQSDKVAKLALGEVDFSYNISGSFIDLLKTLQNLNNSPRLIQIDNVIISKQTASPTVLSITGKAYYLK